MIKNNKTERHIISILTKNQPGVLSRISGLFSRRGYNIDGLTVCATEDESYSRMTVTVSATEQTANQIVEQLKKQIDVIKVLDLKSGDVALRELLLIKVNAGAKERSELCDLCTIFKAKALDTTQSTMMFELTGNTSKIDAFIDVLVPYGIIEMARTGGAALERGKNEN
ncbi:MAG: acetolactate synthase small subunit [Christensenellales bacterium]